MKCPECNCEIKTVPAGISKKTGNPYDEFQVCSNKDCGYKPPRRVFGVSGRETAASQAAPVNGSNTSARTMCLSYAKDLIVAQIQMGANPKQPLKSIIFVYRAMLKEIENPGSTIFKTDESDITEE